MEQLKKIEGADDEIDLSFKLNPSRFDPDESFLRRNMGFGAFIAMEDLRDGWKFIGYTDAGGVLAGSGSFVALFENESGSRVWKHCNIDRLLKLIKKTKNQK